MTDEHPVTMDELKAAYKRAGIWTIGMSFERAMGIPLVRRTLENSALARRRRNAMPLQPRLL